MKTTQKNKRPGGKIPATESLEERVRRHLNDINSVITEEDIKNVKTVSTETAETNNSEEPVNKERKTRKNRKQKKENEVDTSEKQVNPWDILSEGYD
jgi:predicted GIY-YIG superfamily endonuclease